MATKITDQPIRKPFGEPFVSLVNEATVADGGYRGFPKRYGYNEVLVIAVGGTLGARIAFGIPIEHAYFFDASLTGALRWLDYGHARDPKNNDLMDGMKTATKTTPAMTSSDYLYFATNEFLSGYHLEVTDDGQTNASVVNVDVSTSQSAWTNHAAGGVTDTMEKPSGDAFASTGEISLDILPNGLNATPEWVPARLLDLVGSDALDLPNITSQDKLVREQPYYWARLAVNNTLTAFVISSIMGCDMLLAHSTTKGDIASSALYMEKDVSYTFDVDDSMGGVMFCSIDAGTPITHCSWLYRD